LHLQIQPQLTCPSCWARLDPADLLWVSSHPDLRGDPYLGTDALKRFLPSRFDVDGFAIDAKGLRCQSLACPRCHQPIPRILVELKPTFISILGAPASGKSYFIASCVWEIRKRFRQFHVSFADADPVANQIISRYEQKLFLNEKPDQFVALPKTEQEGELYQLVNYGDRQELYAKPFVFSLRPNSEHLAVRQGRDVRMTSRALCLYDNAGEHFQPSIESELSPATDHLALSEALLYVFDPLQHPRFRARCREWSNDPQLGDEFRCYRQDEVLLEAAKRIRQKANMPHHERFHQPLIIVVNKYDAWQRLIPQMNLRHCEPFRTLPDGTRGLDLQTIQAVSTITRTLLEETSPEVVAACDSFGDNVTFIPASPQGCSPERHTTGRKLTLGVRPEQIDPIWADVPLLYGLSKAKCALVPTVAAATAADRDGIRGATIPRIYKGSA
jgi:hypothetical protein